MNFDKALNIIGLNSDYTEEELKKKYHSLAKQYHPDALINQTIEEIKAAEKKMKEINLAYDTLKKDKKSSFSAGQSSYTYKQTRANEEYDFIYYYRNSIINIIQNYNWVNIDGKKEFVKDAANFKTFFINFTLDITYASTKEEIARIFSEFKRRVKNWYNILKDSYFKTYNIPKNVSFTINEDLSFDEFYESLENFKHSYDNVIKEIDDIIYPYKLYTNYEIVKEDIEKLREETIKNVYDDYNEKDYYYQNLQNSIDNLFKYYSTNIALYTELEEIISNNNLPFQRRIENFKENICDPLFYLYYMQLKLAINNLLDYQSHEEEIPDIENNLTKKYNEAVKNIKDEKEKNELYFFYKSIVHYLRTQKGVSFQSLKLLNEIDFNNCEEVLKIHDMIDNNLITNKKIEIYINELEPNTIASRHIKIDDEEYDMLSNNGETVIFETYHNIDNFISLDEFMAKIRPFFTTFDWNGEHCIGLYNYDGLRLCIYKGHIQFLINPAITNTVWYPDHKFSMFQSKDYVKSLLINACYSEIEKFKENNKTKKITR